MGRPKNDMLCERLGGGRRAGFSAPPRTETGRTDFGNGVLCLILDNNAGTPLFLILPPPTMLASIVPLLALCAATSAQISELPTIPSDLSTPVQVRITFNGPTGKSMFFAG